MGSAPIPSSLEELEARERENEYPHTSVVGLTPYVRLQSVQKPDRYQDREKRCILGPGTGKEDIDNAPAGRSASNSELLNPLIALNSKVGNWEKESAITLSVGPAYHAGMEARRAFSDE
ncbi:unnamed protein product [Cyclocybe aegerita]|uniref:Uncharacterized protein n=1 Tax=Cyclocybe aegerita TaxID=1973307 RepID=A0A8S0WCD3_CYCAE|nr:unnamed protein product [Cyclocybe aegerita]